MQDMLFFKDILDTKGLADKLGGNVDLINSGYFKAWNALLSSPTLRKISDNLIYVDNYVKKHPNSLSSIKSNFDGLIEARKQSFLKGLNQAAQEPLNIANARRANPNEISSAVNKLADHRGGSSGSNFGYVEGNVNGSTVDNKVWSSGAANPQVESQIFHAIPVTGSSGDTWLRNTDAEYKMLNNLADDLGGVSGNSYPNINGT